MEMLVICLITSYKVYLCSRKLGYQRPTFNDDMMNPFYESAKSVHRGTDSIHTYIFGAFAQIAALHMKTAAAALGLSQQINTGVAAVSCCFSLRFHTCIVQGSCGKAAASQNNSNGLFCLYRQRLLGIQWCGALTLMLSGNYYLTYKMRLQLYSKMSFNEIGLK